MGWREDSEDLAQEYALERAEAAAAGRSPRPRRWVHADFFRRAHGKLGERRFVGGVDIDRVADVSTYPAEVRRRFDAIETALRVARGLPIAERSAILPVLTYLVFPNGRERVRYWFEVNQGRKEPHHVIASETGLRRETVTRAICALRRAGILPETAGRRDANWRNSRRNRPA